MIKFVSVDADRAAVWPDRTADRLDQRRFSCTVFTHDRMDFTLFKRKGYIIQCCYARIQFCYIV